MQTSSWTDWTLGLWDQICDLISNINIVIRDKAIFSNKSFTKCDFEVGAQIKTFQKVLSSGRGHAVA